MGTFGTLSRKLPQDDVPTLPAVYPFFRRSPEIEDRRDQKMSALEEAQILMGLLQGSNPRYPAAGLPVGQATPLAVSAGMLDVVPSHERWLAERIGSQPSSITVSSRVGGEGMSTHTKTPRPAQRYMDLIDPAKEP